MTGAALQGKVALVTGSAGGIGLAIARRFGQAGARVVLSSRDEARGLAALAHLREEGADAMFHAADLAQEEAVRGLVEAGLGHFGGIDVLVNNAGPSGEAFGLAAIDALPTAILEQTLRIGLFAPFWCCKYVLPHMRARGGGAIVNVSAVAALRALPLMGAYSMAKAALDALGRQVARDHADAGIRCNTLAVGTVRAGDGDVSTLPEGFDHEPLDAAIGATTMLGRVGRYGDVAEAALYLASPASGYMTGGSLPVEGGALTKLQYPDYREHLG